MKLLGIDYGDSKIGLAVGDTETNLASPLKILKNKNKRQVLADLTQLCETEMIGKVILGLPISSQSKVSDQAKLIKSFQGDLDQALTADVVSYDESFTTQQAKKLSPHGDEDDIAAMIILQSYLDEKNK